MAIPAPHGGRLISRFCDPGEVESLTHRTAQLPPIMLTLREVSDFELIASGVFSPLEGFMGSADYQSVLERMRLASNLPWSLPITLSITREQHRSIRVGGQAALLDPTGLPLGILQAEEIFSIDNEKEANAVFGTSDPAHPGVAQLKTRGDLLLGGRVTAIRRSPVQKFTEYQRDPVETRRLFAERGWNRVVGFQTRNPIHRAHEYIQKCALEITDGLLLHPIVGETKNDDIPAEIRMRCYTVLLENYYPKGRTVLSVFPAAMRYAGPKEAIFHAICRKNYGCSHFIVGRDHAGVGNFYGPLDAQKIFSRFEPGELGIQPLFFENSFFCRRCQGMVSAKTCPHDAGEHVTLSGTKVREMLRAGVIPPAEFSRPEVAKILIEAMSQQGSAAS